MSTHGFPYRFALGTTGIVVECKVAVVSGKRQIESLTFQKMGVFHNDRPSVATEEEVAEAWTEQPGYKWSHRTLRQEIERVTQATFS